VLTALAGDGLLAYHEVHPTTPDGQLLHARAPDPLPALFDETGRMLAHGRLSEKRLRRDLTTT
jgi:hypothetical protein